MYILTFVVSLVNTLYSYNMSVSSCKDITVWIMNQYDLMFDLKVNVGHCCLFHGPVILRCILKTI